MTAMGGQRHRAERNELVSDGANSRLVSRLLLEGYSPADVAASTGLSKPQVTRIVAKLRERWLADADNDFKSKLAAELARLQELEREAKRAWRRSQRPARVVKQDFVRKEVEAAPAEPLPMDDLFADPDEPRPVGHAMVLVQEHREERGQHGDPRFLDIAVRCVEARLKAMGAYKDVNVYANCITAEQMMQFARAFLEAAKLEIPDAEVLQRLQARTIKLLPGASHEAEERHGEADGQRPEGTPDVQAVEVVGEEEAGGGGASADAAQGGYEEV